MPGVDAGRLLSNANSDVVWGWKRDTDGKARTVYFSGDLAASPAGVVLDRWYLYYRHRLEQDEADCLADTFLRGDLERHAMQMRLKRQPNGYWDLRLDVGMPTATDSDRVRRLQLRRPRTRWHNPVMPAPRTDWAFDEIFPADVYVGSGLSYEAGLPTLCDVHHFFGVDAPDGSRFTVGAEDPLPSKLVGDLGAVLREFCAVHTLALSARPTFAMHAIRSLVEAGMVRKVFTDNVDNMLAKLHIPFERTRGSGVFNERYPATFSGRSLVVIGVAADRRMLVSQARAKRIAVIVVNPCEKIAPMVRHLDYIRPTDLFIQTTAEAFFQRVLADRRWVSLVHRTA